MDTEKIIKNLAPPILLKNISGFFYGWSGNYVSWDEAKKKTTGYNSEIIFNKVKASLLKIKNEEAVYERDSVIFDRVYYSFPLLSALSLIALNNKERLNVLDFGGSLGSSYYQNRKFFSGLKQFNWCIVEQPHFVKEGIVSFADDHLHFHYDFESCMKKFEIDVLLLSSVLQYLENPFSFLDEVLKKTFKYIIIDRTPLLLKDKDRITIQRVPKNIYPAKYPCWLLNEKKLCNYFQKDYSIVFETELEEKINLSGAVFKAFFFKRKEQL